MSIGSDQIPLPTGAYQVALTADTSTTTALDLQAVADYLDGDGTDYRGQWRFYSAQPFYLKAGDANVTTIVQDVDNDNDEGAPLPAEQVHSFVCKGPSRRYLKFRGGSVGATLFVMRG